MTIELSSVVDHRLRAARQSMCSLARWFAAAVTGVAISGAAVNVSLTTLMAVFGATATAPAQAQQKYVLSPARKVTDTPSAERPDIQDVALSSGLGRSVRLFEISTGIWVDPCQDLVPGLMYNTGPLKISSERCKAASVQATLDDFRELVRIVATTAVGRRVLNAFAIARPLPDLDGTFETRIDRSNLRNFGQIKSLSGQLLRVGVILCPTEDYPETAGLSSPVHRGLGVVSVVHVNPRDFSLFSGPGMTQGARSSPESVFFHELLHALHKLLGEANFNPSDPPEGVLVPIASPNIKEATNWYRAPREEVYTVGYPYSTRYLDRKDPSGERASRLEAKAVRAQLRARLVGRTQYLQDIADAQAASDMTSGKVSADGLSGEVNERLFDDARGQVGRNRYPTLDDVIEDLRFTLPLAQFTPADLTNPKSPRVVSYQPGALCKPLANECPRGRTVPASAVPAEDLARFEAIEAAPDDPLAGQQPYLASVANGGLGIASAWAAGWTGKGQRVAILGTGYRFHLDLPTPGANGEPWMGDYRAAGQWDAVDRDWDATDPGCVGSAWDFSGMKFAGIVGAYRSGTGDTPGQVARAGAQGGVGVAPDARLVYVRAMPACGGINQQALIDGLAYASGAPAAGLVPLIQNPVGTILLAVGPLEKAPCPSDIQVAIDAAVGRGSVVVAPAGNFDGDIKDYWPANCSHVLMVLAGSLSTVGSLITASNDIRSGTSVEVVVGPGDPVLTTSFSHDAAQASTPVYDDVNLTFEAAAVVAGVTSLVRQAEPGLLPAGVLAASAKAAATTSHSHSSTLTCDACGAGWLIPLAAISQAAKEPGGGRLVSWMNGATVSIDTELPSHRVLAPDSVAGTNLVTLRNFSEMTKGEEHWKFQLQPNGGFHIINAVDSRCLDVVPNERSRTTKLALAFAPCSSEASQLWAPDYLGVSKANGGYDHYIYRIAHSRDDLCLYPVDGDVNNTPIALSTCVNQDASPAWNIYLNNNRAAPSSPVFPANSVISNYGYGRVLTAPEAILEPVRLGPRAAVGARAVDIASQQWRFVTIPGGSGTTGQLVNAQTNWCLGAHASAETPNPFVTVIQELCSETPTTLLGLTTTWGSRYVIQWSSYSPLVFSADGDSVGTRRYAANPTQQWSFAK